MQKIRVRGGRNLSGTVRAGGAKNSALKLMAAALLAPGASTITNVPDISDVATMSEVLVGLGAKVTRPDHSLTIDATTLVSDEAPYEMVSRMRASVSVLGALLGRLGKARVALPGGCNIGSRKLDMHFRGLQALGVEITTEHGYIDATADRLRGGHVLLDFPSVGATENTLMAAVLADGETVIENAAREPEIQDLAAFLNEMGAGVEGAGSSTLTIQGVSELRPVKHAVIGDRIEAGTYLVAGALREGPVRVEGFDPGHMEMVLAKLEAAGTKLVRNDDGVTIERTGRIEPVDVQTLPYPGFPTDMQAPFMTLMALADGSCVITENVFESRFMFADELARMGADIRIDDHHAMVRGVETLSGAPVRCPDLRAGAALVVAGLAADGYTEIADIHHIRRGYEGFVQKLASLGADIELIDDGGDQ